MLLKRNTRIAFWLQCIGTLEGYNICRQTKLYLQVAGGTMTLVFGRHTASVRTEGSISRRETRYCLRRLVTPELGKFLLKRTNNCEDRVLET